MLLYLWEHVQGNTYSYVCLHQCSHLDCFFLHATSLDNTALTDVTLRAFGKACRDLSHLYLAGCSRVSDQGLRALGSLRKLQVLNIADCTR